VGIETGYGLDDRVVGVGVPVGSNIFLHVVLTGSMGPIQPIQCVVGAASPGLKRQGREADRSPPTSAEVTKTWIYIAIPAYVFMA
jgi:hypothetical protein